MPRDPRRGGEVGEADRGLVGKRVGRRNRDVQRVLGEAREDEAGVARARGERVMVYDREVELGEPECGQAVGGLEVVDGELEGGVVVSERGDGRGHERLRRGLERGHAQAARDDAGEPGQVRLRDLELREHRLGVGDQRARRVGQPDAAAVALEQRDADLALERGELLRDRGRREREGLGGRRDRPAGGELSYARRRLTSSKAKLSLRWRQAIRPGRGAFDATKCWAWLPATSPSPSSSPRSGASTSWRSRSASTTCRRCCSRRCAMRWRRSSCSRSRDRARCRGAGSWRSG